MLYVFLQKSMSGTTLKKGGIIMLKMPTQFGNMVITDNNETIVTEALKKEIEDNLEEGTTKPELKLEDSVN